MQFQLKINVIKDFYSKLPIQMTTGSNNYL